MVKYKSCRYKGKRMRLHRALLIGMYGERFAEALVVHHKDGNGMNNDQKNLVVLLAEDHARLHAKNRKRDMKGRFVNV